MSKKTAIKHKCLFCKKPVDKRYAVATIEGYLHQMCWRALS